MNLAQRGSRVALTVVLLMALPAARGFVSRTHSFHPVTTDSDAHFFRLSSRPSTRLFDSLKKDSGIVESDDPSTSDRLSTFFDPFRLSRRSDTSNDKLIINMEGNNDPQIEEFMAAAEEDDGKLGIWAARGLLLLVAAIWGTNFAVSTIRLLPPAA